MTAMMYAFDTYIRRKINYENRNEFILLGCVGADGHFRDDFKKKLEEAAIAISKKDKTKINKLIKEDKFLRYEIYSYKTALIKDIIHCGEDYNNDYAMNDSAKKSSN